MKFIVIFIVSLLVLLLLYFILNNVSTSNQINALQKIKDDIFEKYTNIEHMDNEESDDDETDCPNNCYVKNDEYFVYINPNDTSNRRTGEISYGKDKDNAREIFKKNFPKCKIPSILEKETYTDKCPFIIDNGNPCYDNNCSDYNWENFSEDDIDNINDGCKRSIYNYCLTNSKFDDKCKFWKEDTEENKKIVRKFIDTSVCNPENYDIEQHPDFHKYIKKDNIPCWNCKIE